MFWGIVLIIILGWTFIELARCCYRYEENKTKKKKNKKRK